MEKKTKMSASGKRLAKWGEKFRIGSLYDYSSFENREFLERLENARLQQYMDKRERMLNQKRDELKRKFAVNHQ
jgi:hypothetical protein